MISPYVIESVGPKWARALFTTGEGFDGLLVRLRTEAKAAMSAGSAGWLVTRARQADAMKAVLASLETAVGDRNRPLEMVAEDLRAASDGIGCVTGRIDVEDVLDRLFGEFCIGK